MKNEFLTPIRISKPPWRKVKKGAFSKYICENSVFLLHFII
jgi:hypothetical protein